jgi:hypothetical protein
MKYQKGNDHNGKISLSKSWYVFGFWIIKEKHEIGDSCSFCKEIDSNHGEKSAGIWIPATKNGWWTLWFSRKGWNNYLRIT